ncbi:MAG: Maf/YceF/YhdE family protein [Solimicrobium sp.]|jgi:septum formation protein|nr:Maf/YceF/YhdE family protein [Solimicrobium sp.]
MTETCNENRIILASSSIYRKELLSRLHLLFDAISPNIDESAFPDEAPQATALRLAKLKAHSVAKMAPGTIVIGSDQVATLDNLHIGKPGTHQNALTQLQMMRGKRVIFHSALCVYKNCQPTPFIQLDNIQTEVTFRDLPDAELEAYLHIEKPYDCAGSAKNEGLGIAILERIESSDPTALTGLPLITLTSMLRKAGVKFFQTI